MRSKNILAFVAVSLLTTSLFSGCEQKKDTALFKIKSNEVVPSIFYAPCMWQLAKTSLQRKE